MIPAMFFTMITSLILGMGVPTTANYCIMAATCAPILIAPEIGINLVCAHFFVFYFGIVADITPPVALAAYAGSAIAKAPPMKTALNATRLAVAAFIVPYILAFNPAMVFIDTNALQVVQICITSLLGIFGIAAALNGFLFGCISIHMIIPKAGSISAICPKAWNAVHFGSLPGALGRVARRAKRTRPQRECTEVAADNFVPRCCSWHVRSPLGYHEKRLYFDSSGRLV